MTSMIEFLAAHKPGIQPWLCLVVFLFMIGVYGVLTRRSAVGIIIALELMINAAALNFVVFNHFIAPKAVDGQMMALFIIAIAAAEVVVAMAIVVALYRTTGTVDVNRSNKMKH